MPAILMLAGLVSVGPCGPAAAEPLLLRIRPQGADPAAIGAAGALSEAEIARRARAAREAVWERANARAHIAIASVCTGCMKPLPAPPAPPAAEAAPDPGGPPAPPTGAASPTDLSAGALAALQPRTAGPSQPRPAEPAAGAHDEPEVIR